MKDFYHPNRVRARRIALALNIALWSIVPIVIVLILGK